MDLLIYNFFNTILMVWCILDVVYLYIETKKLIYAIWYYGNQWHVNVFQKILVNFLLSSLLQSLY
jgi:hypothetical protein